MWKYTLRPGEKWSGKIGRGKSIRFIAHGKNANVSMLMYNMRDVSEKYNQPDTLKGQYTAYLTEGNVLMSDNGRVLASIVEDSLGWHDTLSGYTSRKLTDERYGKTSYQQDGVRHWLRSADENFAVELVRHNMTARDLTACVNLFSKVAIKEDGSMNFVDEHCREGSTVTLRTEMDIILILSNTPNPLNEQETYPSQPVSIIVHDAPPVDVTRDKCVHHRPENYRAFQNTWDYHKLLGLETIWDR